MTGQRQQAGSALNLTEPELSRAYDHHGPSMDIPILVVRGSPGIKSNGTKDLSDCTHTYEQAERLLFFSLAFQASACRMNAKIFETHDNSLY